MCQGSDGITNELCVYVWWKFVQEINLLMLWMTEFFLFVTFEIRLKIQGNYYSKVISTL